ncbi:Golgi SNAP receptor complex member 1-1 [Hondaea fermentalgiana]|uniref:Golgi SNAP receptor complex member 1-1 n=1 Tax=Hondaea fermentalgiana TaxID=2315210 RepID=A0A2R5G4R9_9STRA|nr:Golgi SNAP receptor complex member 1-1 [Hondaea fermentalgiana]|eukprot:GBG25980.1 Golgi SNAP receptor complex member 1-1 [Hondaea fermentalgiana]
MQSWKDLRRAAKAQENALESALARYVKVDVDANNPEAVGEVEAALETEIGTLLRNLDESIDKLVSCTTQDRPPTSTAQIQRLREILRDQTSTFRMNQKKLNSRRESLSLQRFMARDGARAGGSADRDAETLLIREQDSIQNATHAAGNIIDQASAVHGELLSQRARFMGTTDRLVDMGRRVPGINTLIKRIQDKRTRDNTILALVIAVCVCLILWYELAGWGL